MYRLEFGQQYASVVRGWHQYNESARPEQEAVIDIDIAPDAPARHYDEADTIRSDLETLAENIPTDDPSHETLERMIGADILYLRALEGEKIDFETYVEGTVGIKPEPVAEAKIQAGAAALDMLLREEGLRYDASHREAFHERFSLRGQRQIRQAFRLGMKTVEAALGRYLEVPDDGLEIEYVNKDAYWVGLLSGDRKGLRLAVNTHGRHPLSRGRIDTIVAHEYGGHAAHLRLWARGIGAGLLNPAVGVTAVHTPYAVQAEALAQNAEHILLDDSWSSIFRALYNQQAGRVIHNMHYRINTGHSPRRVQEYGRRRLPLEPDENVSAASLKAFRDNPLQRAYIAAYNPSLEMMAPVRSLSFEGRRAVLGSLYNRALTPEQIEQTVREAARREAAELASV